MEKWMIVYLLPLEVWMDIFCFPWISRREFGQIVDRIGNFKFAEHAQFYLHEWGKRTLGSVHFEKDGLRKYMDFEQYHQLDIPRTPLPENIKSFSFIHIRHFDSRTLDFLGRIQSLLTNLDIQFITPPDHVDNFRTILTTIAPMLDGVHSLQCTPHTLPVVRQCISREQFASLKVLKFSYGSGTENVNTIMEWLTQNNNDGPRRCAISGNNECYEQIRRAICEQFHAAKSPCTFDVLVFRRERPAEFHLENGIGEQLHGVRTENERHFHIIRRPAKCNTQEVLKWIKANTNCSENRGHFVISDPTVGSLDAAQVDVLEQAEQQQQPCSSKVV